MNILQESRSDQCDLVYHNCIVSKGFCENSSGVTYILALFLIIRSLLLTITRLLLCFLCDSTLGYCQDFLHCTNAYLCRFFGLSFASCNESCFVSIVAPVTPFASLASRFFISFVTQLCLLLWHLSQLLHWMWWVIISLTLQLLLFLLPQLLKLLVGRCCILQQYPKQCCCDYN